jgi:hypothetical protein
MHIPKEPTANPNIGHSKQKLAAVLKANVKKRTAM